MEVFKQIEFSADLCEGFSVADLISETDRYNDILLVAYKGKEQDSYLDAARLEEIKELLSQLAYCKNSIDKLTQRIHDCVNEQFTE